MELMEVYHEAVAKWIIARATSRKCEGSEFVFDLIESAIRKKRLKFFSRRSKHQTWSGWISVDCIVTIGSPKLPGLSLRTWRSILSSLVMSSRKKQRTERLFRGSDERLYNLQFGKIRLPDAEPAVVIYIEPLRPTTIARWKK